jgi:hypothetical protein
MRESRTLFREVRELLQTEWDPIGVRTVPTARDEYDNYVPTIARMVATREPVSHLVKYLLAVEREQMGLSGDPEGAARVAGKLFDLGQQYED